MRLLYLYPEEWTGKRAREFQTLATCAALAEAGVEVTLVTAGGEQELHAHLSELADAPEVPGLRLVTLSRTLGPVQSTSIFTRNFNYWMRKREPFDLAYIVHLKAAAILLQAGIPYAYEAHGIFTPTQQNPARQKMLHKVEGQVLSSAALHIATSAPLAVALITWFGLSKDFAVVPKGGMPPLEKGVGNPDGPLVYSGSIAPGHDLANVVQAAREVGVPLRIIGGDADEWRLLSAELDTTGIEWMPRVPVHELPEALAGARAGVIPTNPDSPAGEFSCPLKFFDYARCGLPVISTALPALPCLEVGAWCTQIPSPARLSWIEAIQNFRYDAGLVDATLAWADSHTWANRAALLKGAFKMLK